MVLAHYVLGNKNHPPTVFHSRFVGQLIYFLLVLVGRTYKEPLLLRPLAYKRHKDNKFGHEIMSAASLGFHYFCGIIIFGEKLLEMLLGF